MNNLTTRKIVLGMLMTLVLAFGVLGNADALTLSPSTSPSDLSTIATGSTITVSGIRGSLNNVNAEESVTISASSGTIVDYPSGGWTEQTTTSVTSLTDGTGNGTITIPSSVQITAPGAGAVVTVTVSWTPNDSSTARSKEFTFYVVGAFNAGGSTAVALTNGVARVSDQSDTPIDGHFTFTPADHQPVYYSVQGSGRLYVSLPAARDRRTGSTNNLYTSSSAAVYLDTNGGSSKVTAYVAGSSATATALYIFSGGPLSTHPRIEVQSGNNQTGAPEGRLDDYFEVKVTDGRRRAVSGLPVTFTKADPNSPTTASMFIPVSGTKVYDVALDAQSIDAVVPVATGITPGAAETHHVQTDRNGVAKIYYQLSSNPGAHAVTATAHGIGINATLTATASTTARAGVATLEIVSGDNQRADKGKFLTDDLVVRVRSLAGHRIRNSIIQFRTTTGILVPASGTAQPTLTELGFTDSPANQARNPTRGQQIYVKTGPNGEAGVTYNVGQLTEAREVVAEVRHEAGDTQYDFAIDRVVFNINGTGGTGDQQPPPAPATNRLAISPTSITGDPGDTETVTVTALNVNNVAVPNVPITLSVPSAFTTAGGSASSISGNTPFTSTLTLPDDAGTYIITATTTAGYSPASTTVTVAAPTGPGTLTLTLGIRAGNQQPVTVSATRDGSPQNVSYTLRVGTLTYTGQTGATGSITRIITLPSATSAHTLVVSGPAGYNTAQVTALAPGQQTTTPSGPAGEADSIRIDGQRQRSGTVDEELDAPLRVRVIDANGSGVSGVRVTFRVLSPGRGTFPGARGSGRATQDETNRTGYASVDFTPESEGDVIVRVTAAGVSDPVTFIIDVGEASETTTDTRGPGVTPSREINPDVHVGAAQRPPMLWVDSGKIYALVGANVQEFASGVEGAMNITVGGGKVYWTEMTGESSGTINSANLNGSDVQELKAIKAVPMGIAVDTAGSKLYWTNSRGRIQSADLDGSGIENVLQNLPGPKDIAIARGNLYWTQYDATADEGNVGIVNPTAAQRVARYISTGSDVPGSVVIGGNKVYWTEMTGSASGTINSANLNGAGAEELNDIRAVPSGIAVDGSRSKLYWTNSRGRVQNADLDGSGISTVVDGLGNPGDMVLSNSISAPTTTTRTTTTASRSKYDVNGDGSVDNMDAGLVADALGTSNTKYDVNGDGTVNFLDLLLVFDNRDDDAAGAPTVLGMKLTAVQIDRIQEQIDLLIATGDRSPAAMRTLIYLQQLIATARPEKTQLLANYPNPFNPETWIPYELAADTTVKITIYNTQGVVIRTLELGHQSAGYYTGRDRAAYWDGRNAVGEQVASGIYFYQFETDAMSSMRKMVILK